MNEPTIQEWKKAAEEINRVYFPSPLDTALDEMMKDVQVAMVKESGIEMNPDYSPDYYVWEFYKGSISKEELSAIVHEHYGKMQRLLDES